MSALIKNIRQEMGFDSNFHLKMTVEQLTLKVARLENIIRENQKSYILSVPEGNGHRFVDAEDILYIQAQGNYANIFLQNGSQYLISKTLKTIESSLSESKFVRCHAAYLVNLKFICKTSDATALELISGEKIPISRRKYQNLLDQLTCRS